VTITTAPKIMVEKLDRVLGVMALKNVSIGIIPAVSAGTWRIERPAVSTDSAPVPATLVRPRNSP